MKKREADLFNETSRLWGPIRPKALERITHGLDAGTFSSSRVRLINTFRSDIMLYAYVLRNLLQEKGGRDLKLEESLNLVETADLAEIQKCIPPSETFTLTTDVTDHQAVCLRYLTVSVASAAYIADRNGADGGVAFGTTLLRNLPLCLLSFSHPSAFAKAVSLYTREEITLQKAIEQSLHLSYSVYALAFAKHYPEGLVDIIQETGMNRQGVPNPKSSKSKFHLFSLLGESVGRLAAPGMFPLSAAQLNSVLAVIENYMGPHGLLKVEEKVEEMCTDYSSACDVLKTKLRTEELGPIALDTFNTHRCRRAMDGLSLPAEIVLVFENFYRQLPAGEVSVEPLNKLLAEVVPKLGYSHSVIYFLDEGSGRIIPKLKKGKPESSVDQSVLLSESQVMQIVQTAIDAPAPVLRELRYGTKKVYSYIAAQFGGAGMKGVFFVQGGEMLEGISGTDRTNRFQAARRALCDVMNLGY